MSQLSITDFYSETRNDIERFVNFWRRGNETDPASFPMTMNGGDWHDQFMMFLSSEDAESPLIEGRKFNSIPADVAAEAFAYDPASGELRWKERPASHFATVHAQRIFNASHAGKLIQSKTSTGHVHCHLSYQGRSIKLLVHRVAFCLQTGRWPVFQVDHIDGNPANNAWTNLREANAQENARNSKARKHNSTGLKWVKRSADGKKFSARATVNGQSVHFGTFETAEMAHAHAAKRLAEIHGAFLNRGAA
jgi:hypothetical protein